MKLKDRIALFRLERAFTENNRLSRDWKQTRFENKVYEDIKKNMQLCTRTFRNKFLSQRILIFAELEIKTVLS